MKKILFFLFFTIYTLSNALKMEIKTTKLRQQQECKEDIERFCPSMQLTNIMLIKCLQDNMPNDRDVSIDCQNLIWQIKYNITRGTGGYVPNRNFEVCTKDARAIPRCSIEKDAGGPYVACLVEEIVQVQSSTCQTFLSNLRPIIFTDYRLVYRFADVCKNDIENHHCGRNKGHSLNEQGTTIDCLSENLDNLSITCKAEILKLTESQATDWRADRGLYLACKQDKITFCSDRSADAGLVYKCLLEHKERESMSSQCKNKLRRRQNLQGEDYATNFQFFKSCSGDMLKYNCIYSNTNSNLSVKGDASPQNAHKMKMTNVVFCLESVQIAGNVLKGQCIHEVMQMRRQLMADHLVNKKIVNDCKPEVARCTNADEVKRLHDKGMLSSSRHPYVIHCLMDLARHSMNLARPDDDAITMPCYKAVSSLLKNVDVVDNVDVDPALKNDCSLTIKQHCADIPHGKGLVIKCLINLLDTEKIEAECSHRISEIQFFVARDFKLSSMFWGRCEQDIRHLCAKDTTDDITKQAHVLSCLYRNSVNGTSNECNEQVKMAMEERAKSVDLLPEIQEFCLSDLADKCPRNTGRDEEMECLEEHFEELSEDCKREVSRVIEAEETVPMITRLFLNACESFWNVHCLEGRRRHSRKHSSRVNDEKEDEDDAAYLMECLIEKKNDPDMPKKCRVGIEHHQLVSLKHFNISKHFKRACSADINKNCPNERNKVEAVKCLSHWVFNDTLLREGQHVSKKCRRQLKFEILQSRESFKLDDEVRGACMEDRKKYCEGVENGKGAVVACLKQHQSKISDDCRSRLFRREESEALSPEMDFVLMHKCKRMIKEFCLGAPDVFQCLKKNKIHENFEEACKLELVNRMRLRAKDIRLNPKLLMDCHGDIERECQSEMNTAKGKPFESDGIVLYCLRKAFVNQHKRKYMTDSCVKHITDILKEFTMDDVQDPALIKYCSEAIKQKCTEELELDKRRFGGTKVVECLQREFMKDQNFIQNNKLCSNEIFQRISESKIDIQIDPVLYRQCSLDASTVCKGILSGEGRVMACLSTVLKKDENMLQVGCREALKNRIDLWSKSHKLAPPNSVGEMAEHIHSSPSGNFLEFILISFIMVIFCGGLLCGRVTKRVAYQVKSK